MAQYVFDVDTRNFNQVVLEGSKKTPVLVDFWAAWCAPCRALKPILEKLAAEYQGRFILAKVNSDENPSLALEYGVRGIPNVKAFVDGALRDEFSGALPESLVREFIERVLPSPGEALRKRAQEAYRRGDAAGALATLRRALELDPRNSAIRIDMAEILLDSNQVEEAKTILKSLDPVAKGDPRAAALIARAEFAGQAPAEAEAETLKARIARDPNDLDARLQLAKLYVGQKNYEAALEELLEIIRRDRGFGDDAGRKTMLSVFNLLGNQGELVARYRRLLASALH